MVLRNKRSNMIFTIGQNRYLVALLAATFPLCPATRWRLTKKGWALSPSIALKEDAFPQLHLEKSIACGLGADISSAS